MVEKEQMSNQSAYAEHMSWVVPFWVGISNESGGPSTMNMFFTVDELKRSVVLLLLHAIHMMLIFLGLYMGLFCTRKYC